jgi:hypothetical protein
VVGQNRAQDNPRAGYQNDQQQEVDDGQGQPQPLFENQYADEECDGRYRAAQHGGIKDAGADVARYRTVKPQTYKQGDGQPCGGGESQPVGEVRPFVGIVGLEALCKPKRDKYHHDVVDNEKRFFDIAR